MSDKMIALQRVEPSIEQDLALSTQLARSALLPEALRKRPEDVLVTVLTGRELGLSPMQAIRGMYVVNGKAVMSADMMVALVLSKRDVCEFFRLLRSTDDVAEYETKRIGSEPVKMAFTKQQASTAGLLGKGTWKSYPAAMLRARCASALARAVYPDLVAGVYESDEGEEIKRGRQPQPAREPMRIVEAKPSTPAPAPVATFDTAAQPAAPAQVVEGEVVVEAHTASGATLRIVDEPESAPDAGPSLFDELLAELQQHSDAAAFGQWIERCHAAEKKGAVTAEQMDALKSAYKARWNDLKGGR